MTGSLLIKIAIGMAILLVAFAYQNAKLRKMAPSLEDFTRTTVVSGIYSYQQYGRNIVTRIDGKPMYCSLNYNGGTGSCFVPLKHVAPNTRITITAASIKTASGPMLYPNSIEVGGQEVYRVLPEKSLNDWWFGSRLGLATLPLLLTSLYLFVVFVFFTNRG